MAVTRGCFGKVKSGATPDLVAEVRDWSFDESADVIDVSSIGSCTKTKTVGAINTSGTINCWWDPADTGQGNFVIGDIIALELHPGGDASGTTYYETATAIISSISRRGGVDGAAEANFSFEVNGGMTTSTTA